MGDISYYHYFYAIKAGMPTELDMQEIIFDFTGCKYIIKLYDIIQESFGFPDWFERNWMHCVIF